LMYILKAKNPVNWLQENGGWAGDEEKEFITNHFV
jgi:hypothetical protein